MIFAMSGSEYCIKDVTPFAKIVVYDDRLKVILEEIEMRRSKVRNSFPIHLHCHSVQTMVVLKLSTFQSGFIMRRKMLIPPFS